MERREFLVGAASAAAALGLSRVGWAQTARQPDPAKLARIAIMTLDFNAMLKLPGQPSSPERTLEIFDVPQMYADVYGVHNIEFQHAHLASTEDSYLKELRARMEKTKSRVTNINLEFGTMNISSPDPALRVQAIDLTRRWVDHAIVLGSPRVMINQGQPTDENKAWSVPTLRAMGDYGRSKGIMVSVETRLTGGTSAAVGRAGSAAPPMMNGVAAPIAAPGYVAASPASTNAGAGAAAGNGAQGTGAGPAAGAGGAAAGRGTVPAAQTPVVTGLPQWVLLAELIKNSGTYSNVDLGNTNSQNQGELHAALRTLLPMTVGNIHTRINPLWDLPTALKFITQNLGYTGLFSIEAPGGHDPVRNIYNIILDSI